MVVIQVVAENPTLQGHWEVDLHDHMVQEMVVLVDHSQDYWVGTHHEVVNHHVRCCQGDEGEDLRDPLFLGLRGSIHHFHQDVDVPVTHVLVVCADQGMLDLAMVVPHSYAGVAIDVLGVEMMIPH